MTRPSKSLSSALFGKARRNVLALLFGNPDHAFYTREIVKHAGTGASQVQRELENLTAAGLLVRSRRGNQVYFQANPQAPIFDELKAIVFKTFGVADVIRDTLLPFTKRIGVAFIYGSIARREDTGKSDIDIFVVGDVPLSKLSGPLAEAEAGLRRPVSPTIYTPDEFADRIRRKNHFVTRVLEQPKIFLIGDEHDLRWLAEPESAES